MFSAGENVPVSRRSPSTFPPRRNKLKSLGVAQSLCTLRRVGGLELPMVSWRVKPCLREAGVGDFDKEDGTEVAGGPGEEADFRSFILERGNAETILIHAFEDFVQLTWLQL